MTNILKFQTKQDKAKAEHLSLTFHVQTDILDDGSIWYKIGTQASWDKEIIWDKWRKVDMSSVIGYVVMRYETPLDDSPGIASCIEQVFVSFEKARQHKLRLDPEGQGFEYHCPCGCGEEHYRAWYVQPVILNLEEE